MNEKQQQKLSDALKIIEEVVYEERKLRRFGIFWYIDKNRISLIDSLDEITNTLHDILNK